MLKAGGIDMKTEYGKVIEIFTGRARLTSRLFAMTRNRMKSLQV